MTIARGIQIENTAIKYLHAQAVKILQRNYRCKVGEIDLIARDNEDLIFVEVRYRQNQSFGTAAETVNFFKQRKIVRAAELFLQKNRWAQQANCRFDVIALSKSINKPEIEWIKDAFNA